MSSTELLPRPSLDESMDYPTFSSANVIGDPEISHAEDQADPLGEIVKDVDPNNLDQPLLDSVIDRHPIIQQLTSDFKRVTEARDKKQERKLADEIKVTRLNIGDQIKLRLGISVEDESTSLQRAETERKKRLGQALISLRGKKKKDQQNGDEVLAAFGLIDESGAMRPESMDSPFFSLETQKAFNQYLDYVKKYEKFKKLQEELGYKIVGADQADVLRKEAHNIVATLVAQDLGLKFGVARNFVAKAREEKFPGTAEKETYSAAVRVMGQKLMEKYGYDAAEFTRETLRPLLSLSPKKGKVKT